ncbi:MAG TPA: glutaredoxin family protein, partial [Telluria sp.]|nr:glutaredoxin family protein [Telluria sp.]
MIYKFGKQALVYMLIVAAGAGLGWGAPRAVNWLKPAYSQGDYSAYYAGLNTNVVVYGTATCPYCKKTREYLRANHIAFADIDVAATEKGKTDFDKLGGSSVPVVLIGDR